MLVQPLSDKRNRVIATTRLPIAEFAVSDYLEEYGALPRSLEVLELDSAVLIDPFSTRQASLQYRHGDGEFTLYSVGPDGDDDGGTFDPMAGTRGDYFLHE
jgi:hypothetical protein